MTERRQLESAIEAQEALRGVVPDDVIDAAVAALRQRLASSSIGDERRRQVTVLFADVSGFTAMSSGLDPEVVATRMNELWERLDAIVVDLGGRVDKHVGDALMALWGAVSTAEGDPERAVRAGLAMQQELRRRDAADGLALRVGINTGPVHLGAVGAGAEFTAMGDTVNVASRVEGVAPLHGVLVTHDTYRHIRGVFDVEPLDPVLVKGKTDPLRVYLVHGAKERRFRMPTRGVEGVETPMVGRAGELATLQAEFDRVVERGEARLVTVLGDAGIGKSRLLYELDNWIELHPVSAYFFKGRALATRAADAFALLRDALADRFGVPDSAATSVVATTLRQGFAPALDADASDLVGHWLGFDLRSSPAVQRLLGSGQLAVAARAHLFEYIGSLAAAGPVVVFLEDLHWADDESLAVVDELVTHLAPRPLLVVGVGRPSLLERPGAAGMLERSSVTLTLGPLGDHATRELVTEILKPAGDVPDQLIDLVLDRAEGNAFYVEELVKMLIDDGVIETGTTWDPWHIDIERLRPEQIPATLTGVLQSRLDSLARDDLDVLQRASVVGRVFWDAAVDSLGIDGSDPAAGALELAGRRELVFRKEVSSFDDTMEFTFKHALLRDVTYETVLLRDRQRLHHLVARWMSRQAGERVSEYWGNIALHLRLAGDLGAAADLLHRAGRATLDAGNALAARRNLEEALELWSEAKLEPAVDALTAMTEACLRLGDIDVADRYGREALPRAVKPEARAWTRYLASWIASEQGDHDRERAMLDEAVPDAERLGGVLLVRVVIGLAWYEVLAGNLPAAQVHADRAAVLVTQLDDPVATREVYALLGAVAGMDGDIRASLRYSEEALEIAVASGDLEGQAVAQSNIGVARHLLGDADGSLDEYRLALDHYRESKSLYRRLGRALRDGVAAANMAQIQIRLGDDAAARALVREALLAVRLAAATATLLFCVTVEADRRLTRGETTRGLELLALVRSHPAVTQDTRDDIVRILGRAALEPDVLDAMPTTGAGVDIAVIADALLVELAG